MRRADVVVWLAALVGDGACALDPDLTRKINVESVRWLASVFDGRIVFMSTCSVYGAQDGELTEEQPGEPAVPVRADEARGRGGARGQGRARVPARHAARRSATTSRGSASTSSSTRSRSARRSTAGCPSSAAGSTGRCSTCATSAQIVVDAMTTARPRGSSTSQPRTRPSSRSPRRFGARSRTRRSTSPRRRSRTTATTACRAGRPPSGSASTRSSRMDDGIVQVQRLIEEGRVRDLTSPRFSNFESLRPTFARTPRRSGERSTSPTSSRRTGASRESDAEPSRR